MTLLSLLLIIAGGLVFVACLPFAGLWLIDWLAERQRQKRNAELDQQLKALSEAFRQRREARARAKEQLRVDHAMAVKTLSSEEKNHVQGR